MRARRRSLPPESPPAFEARVLPNLAALARAAADEFAAAARDAVASRGVFRAVLAGGSTPRAVHERLATRSGRTRIDWKATRFFWGDERCVAPTDERSNYRMALETLLLPLRIPSDHVFRMRGEDEPRSAAGAYEERLRREGGGRLPRFDFVFLGLGADGHTASLFPRTRALEERRAGCAANWVPARREWRMTLTYPVLNAARRVVFVVAGAEKKDPAGRILRRAPGWRDLPAARVRPRRGSLLWLLDEAADGEP